MNVVFSDEQDDPLPDLELADLAGLVLAEEGLPETTEMSLVLVDAGRMASLNEEHMGKPGATDVLSFPLEELAPGVGPDVVPGGPPPHIGDVFVCPTVVRATAAAAGVSYADELALMVVHGALHLLGYDHVVDDDAELMESRERRLLAMVGRTRP